MNILIAEDNTSFIVMLKWALKDLGDYHIDLVSDGKKALKLIKENKYDFIILDNKMPEIDGIDIIREINSIVNDNMQVVLITADISTNIEKIITKEKLKTKFLTKPFDIMILKKMIFSLIAKQSLEKYKNLSKD